jgi:phosphopantothenoylcysteine decarboxylase/phosphopantothenate--cysteine ligase
VTGAAPILLGVGGGIAAFKAAALASRLVQRGHEVRVALTRDALDFVGARTFAGLTGRPAILSATQIDPDGSAPHIAVASRARCLVVVPATAALIARIAAGVADDPVTLAATVAKCRRIFCPAMNDAMWEDRVVQRNVRQLEADGWERLGPVVGPLAEGYDAIGRMVEPDAILAAIDRS